MPGSRLAHTQAVATQEGGSREGGERARMIKRGQGSQPVTVCEHITAVSVSSSWLKVTFTVTLLNSRCAGPGWAWHAPNTAAPTRAPS